MKLFLQTAAYFFIGFPCFYCCLAMVRTEFPLKSNSRRPPLWAGVCALLFSVFSLLGAQMLPNFLSCILALALVGIAAWLPDCAFIPFHMVLALVLFFFLAVTILDLAIGLLLAVFLPLLPQVRNSPGCYQQCVSFLSSAMITVAAYRLVNRKNHLFRLIGNQTSQLAVVCCTLLILGLTGAGQDGNPAPLHTILLPLLLLSILLCAICLRVFRQKGILKQELHRKTAELDQKTEEMKLLHTEIHTYRGLVQSTKSKVDEMNELVNRYHAINRDFCAEFAEEFDSLRQNTLEIYRLTSKHAEESFLISQSLPKTGFPQLDLLLGDCLKLCVENSILLNLSVMTPFEEQYRPAELEGPFLAGSIAEHVLDAIRAVLRFGQDGGEIDVTMGLFTQNAGCAAGSTTSSYGVDIYDNGEPFPLEVLARLGAKDGVTTGGSGIGFPTTLERLALCNGSLLIQDFDPQDHGGMTTCVSLLFDGKRRFEIHSDTRQTEIDTLRQQTREAGLILLANIQTSSTL